MGCTTPLRPRGNVDAHKSRGVIISAAAIAFTATIAAAAAAAAGRAPHLSCCAALLVSAVLVEAVFGLYYWLAHAHLFDQQKTSSPADVCPIETCGALLAAVTAEDVREFVLGWFPGCERFEEIKRCAETTAVEVRRTLTHPCQAQHCLPHPAFAPNVQ